jgi:hypothetical protein
LHYEPSNIVIGFVIWLPVVYVGVAIAEYVAHRWVMHRNTTLTKGEFEKHAVQHHGRRVMEPRYPYVDLALHCHLIYGAPAWGGFLIGFLCGRPYALGGLIATLTMFTFHSYVWSTLHRAQHDLEDNWTCRLPRFAELEPPAMRGRREMSRAAAGSGPRAPPPPCGGTAEAQAGHAHHP